MMSLKEMATAVVVLLIVGAFSFGAYQKMKVMNATIKEQAAEIEQMRNVANANAKSAELQRAAADAMASYSSQRETTVTGIREQVIIKHREIDTAVDKSPAGIGQDMASVLNSLGDSK